MRLDLIDVATREQWLTDARAAYQSLLIGESAQAVDHSGKRVTFTAAQSDQLARWIALLEHSLGRGKRRPIRPIF